MSKLSKFFACAALAAGLTFAQSGAADAGWRHHHRGWHGGFGPGFALGLGLGFGAPRYYSPGYYPRRYYARDCGWVRERVWYRGYWRWRRAWQCW